MHDRVLAAVVVRRRARVRRCREQVELRAAEGMWYLGGGRHEQLWHELLGERAARGAIGGAVAADACQLAGVVQVATAGLQRGHELGGGHLALSRRHMMIEPVELRERCARVQVWVEAVLTREHGERVCQTGRDVGPPDADVLGVLGEERLCVLRYQRDRTKG